MLKVASFSMIMCCILTPRCNHGTKFIILLVMFKSKVNIEHDIYTSTITCAKIGQIQDSHGVLTDVLSET